MSGALSATNLRAFAEEWVDCVPHIATLTRLAREAETVIEWGVRGGVSTWAILDGLPENGTLTSVDIVDCIVPPRVQNDPRWTFIVGDDRDEAVQARLPATADLVFIDTSHEYQHTVDELELAWARLPRRIALHDYALDDVRRAVDEFAERYGWHKTIETSQWGFAILDAP